MEYPLREARGGCWRRWPSRKKLVNLVKELGDVDVEAEVALMRERGLVFHESERILSVVVPPPTPVQVPLARTELATSAA